MRGGRGNTGSRSRKAGGGVHASGFLDGVKQCNGALRGELTVEPERWHRKIVWCRSDTIVGALSSVVFRAAHPEPPFHIPVVARPCPTDAYHDLSLSVYRQHLSEGVRVLTIGVKAADRHHRLRTESFERLLREDGLLQTL